jgi:co-chaperonin GroES (HSP10)
MKTENLKEKTVPSIAELGIRLLDYKVLIELDDPIARIGSILIPDSAREDVTTGTYIAGSPFSFDYLSDFDGYEKYLPEPGERIFCTKYAGRDVTAKNGKKYRLMNDKDVFAILDFPK